MPSTVEPRLYDTLTDLVRRRSVTPDDAGCSELIAERLAALGFTNEWLNHEGVTNLWSTWGDSGPLLVLAGHTDVVPSGPVERWASDPYTPVVRDGHLYGRGAADMKSGLSAMLCAVEDALVAKPPAIRLAFLITSDEEGPCRHGTRHVVDVLRKRGIRPDFAIVGEATAIETVGDRVTVGRRGSLNCVLQIHGVQGHIAYPDRADNPIHRALPALAELSVAHWDDGHESFPPTSFQISNFNSGTGANNVIPGHADILINFRYAPTSTAEQLKSRVEDTLKRHAVDYTATWTLSGEPYFTPDGELTGAVRKVIAKCCDLEPVLFTGGGTSDGRFIATLGTQVVEIGPVNASIHKIDEHVRLADLNPLRDIYCGIINELACPPASD